MTSTRKTALVMGFQGSSDPSSPISVEKLDKMLEVESKRLSEAGIDMQSYLVDRENKSTLDEITQILKSKHWDAITIGFGVRCDKELTPLFEGIINTAADVVHPTPKMGFPVYPDAVVEALQRIYPERF